MFFEVKVQAAEADGKQGKGGNIYSREPRQRD